MGWPKNGSRNNSVVSLASSVRTLKIDGKPRQDIDSASEGDENEAQCASPVNERNRPDESEIADWEQLIEVTGSPEGDGKAGNDDGSDDDLGPSPQKNSRFLQLSGMIKGTGAHSVYNAFGSDEEQMTLKWVDASTVNLIFESEAKALEAYFGYLSSSHSIGTLSPLDEEDDSLKSFESEPRPYVPKVRSHTFGSYNRAHTAKVAPSSPTLSDDTNDRRPPKTSSVAKRLIAGALGVRAPRATKAEKEHEDAMKQRVTDERAQKAAAQARKQAIWDD